MVSTAADPSPDYGKLISSVCTCDMRSSANPKRYNHRESNPGYLDGNEICYHYTMIVVLQAFAQSETLKINNCTS